MRTLKNILIVVLAFVAIFGYSQGKTVSNIPVMNKDGYSWCSRQVFEINVDSISKTYNAYFKDNVATANTEYRNTSNLLINELFNLISLSKIQAYSYQGTAIPFTDVRSILANEVFVKEAGSNKVIKGMQKQNIISFRIVEDVYINKKTLTVETKLLALIPIAAVYTEQAELRGSMQLFYIYF